MSKKDAILYLLIYLSFLLMFSLGWFAGRP
jgi:hypothetical protein